MRSPTPLLHGNYQLPCIGSLFLARVFSLVLPSWWDCLSSPSKSMFSFSPFHFSSFLFIHLVPPTEHWVVLTPYAGPCPGCLLFSLPKPPTGPELLRLDLEHAFVFLALAEVFIQLYQELVYANTSVVPSVSSSCSFPVWFPAVLRSLAGEPFVHVLLLTLIQTFSPAHVSIRRDPNQMLNFSLKKMLR